MRKGNFLKAVWWVGVVAAMCCSVRAWADATVYVRASGFSPASVSIKVGETVYFIVADDNGPYCVQSTIGAWTPWYLWDYGDGFGLTFNQKGDYHYRDIFTYNTGVIHVGTPNTPPSVGIISPTNGAVFTAPASFTFAAAASDSDNGVWSVEFYVGAELVDTDYTSPYSTQVTNLAAGEYMLTAIVYDNAWVNTSDYVTISVQPPPLTCSRPRLVGGQFQFEAIGLTVGKQAVLQASTSLGSSANWISLQTVTVTDTTVAFSRPVLAGAQFFRVLQLP